EVLDQNRDVENVVETKSIATWFDALHHFAAQEQIEVTDNRLERCCRESKLDIQAEGWASDLFKRSIDGLGYCQDGRRFLDGVVRLLNGSDKAGLLGIANRACLD